MIGAVKPARLAAAARTPRRRENDERRAWRSIAPGGERQFRADPRRVAHRHRQRQRVAGHGQGSEGGVSPSWRRSEADVRPHVAERAQLELNQQRLGARRWVCNDGAAWELLEGQRLTGVGRIRDAERGALILVAEAERIADRIEDWGRLSQRVVIVTREVDDERSVDRPAILEAVASASDQAFARKLESERRLRGVKGIIDGCIYAGVARLEDPVKAVKLPASSCRTAVCS